MAAPSPNLGAVIALVPLGALLGFGGAILIEILIGLIAGPTFNAEHPSWLPWRMLGFLPGTGALVGAVVAPIITSAPDTNHPPNTDRTGR